MTRLAAKDGSCIRARRLQSARKKQPHTGGTFPFSSKKEPVPSSPHIFLPVNFCIVRIKSKNPSTLNMSTLLWHVPHPLSADNTSCNIPSKRRIKCEGNSPMKELIIGVDIILNYGDCKKYEQNTHCTIKRARSPSTNTSSFSLSTSNDTTKCIRRKKPHK